MSNMNLYSRFSVLFSKLGKFKLLFILSPYVILIIIGLYFSYDKCRLSFVKNGVKYTRKSICGEVKTAEALPIPKNQNAKKVNAKVFTNAEVGYWEIIDTNRTPYFPTGLRIYNKDLPSPIVKWNNFLLAVNLEHYIGRSGAAFLGSPASEHDTLQSQIRTIRVFNIDTGETFDISLDKPIWGEFWYVTNQVLDNAYYFGVGGAFGASLGYKLDLPPQRSSRITKLASTIGNSISKYGNAYVSSFCYEGCTYSLFNPISLTTTPLERMTNANNERIIDRKEEFLGIDSQGRMILNIRNIQQDKNTQQQFNTELIAAAPLNNETITIPLLKANDLPKGIRSYFMIDNIDKILMVGSSKAYIYNIVSNNLKEIQIEQKLLDELSSNKIFITKTDKDICFVGTNTIQSALDLVNEIYLNSPPSTCKKLYTETTKEELFKRLNLPNNFEFIYIPAIIKTYDIINGISESELPKDAEIIK